MVNVQSSWQLKAPKVLDLFCGCGGFSLGAARAGFNVVAGVDFDKHAIATHARNFKQSEHLKLDICETTGTEILEQIGLDRSELTGIIGGPPCQGFSYMGSNNANDPRNQLFRRFYEIVAELKPQFFVCENVPGLLHEKYKHIRVEALAIVSDDYDIVGPVKMRASDYGAPTIRTRAFFIGTLKSSPIKFQESDFLPSSDIVATTVEDALVGLPKKINEAWQAEEQGWRTVRANLKKTYFTERALGVIPEGMGDVESMNRLKSKRQVSGCLGTVHLQRVIERFAEVPEGKSDKISRAPRLNRKGFCPTLRAGTGSDRGSFQAVRPIHPTENRVITPREGARLQGFPDWFRFDATKWHSFRQIGNSVSPIMAERVLYTIARSFIND
ncbi:MAG: DNA (cytosine-5)-methyltransferase 1 [Bacteroidia bacterium]|jgi:DNA (cytosine-5)-methyltransferase 1